MMDWSLVGPWWVPITPCRIMFGTGSAPTGPWYRSTLAESARQSTGTQRTWEMWPLRIGFHFEYHSFIELYCVSLTVLKIAQTCSNILRLDQTDKYNNLNLGRACFLARVEFRRRRGQPRSCARICHRILSGVSVEPQVILVFWCFRIEVLLEFDQFSLCSAAKTPSPGEDGCYRCCHQSAGRSGLESWTSLASMSCSLCSDGKPPTSSLDQMMSIHVPHFIPGVESWKWMSWYWLVLCLCQSFSRIVCMAFHLRWLASCDPWPGYGLGPHAAEAECCGRAQRPSDWQRASVSTSKTCAPACNWPQMTTVKLGFLNQGHFATNYKPWSTNLYLAKVCQCFGSCI